MSMTEFKIRTKLRDSFSGNETAFNHWYANLTPQQKFAHYAEAEGHYGVAHLFHVARILLKNGVQDDG